MVFSCLIVPILMHITTRNSKFYNFDFLCYAFMHELILKIDPILDGLEKIAVTQRIMQLETPEIVHSIKNSKLDYSIFRFSEL